VKTVADRHGYAAYPYSDELFVSKSMTMKHPELQK